MFLCLHSRVAASRIARASKTVKEREAPLLSSARLVRWIYRTGIESPPSMLPSHLDGGFHTVGQDDKLGRPAVVMGAKAYDVDLSHSGRENSEKPRPEQGGTRERAPIAVFRVPSSSLPEQANPPRGKENRTRGDRCLAGLSSRLYH